MSVKDLQLFHSKVRPQRTDYFMITVSLLTRRSAINLKCNNFMVFILYFCVFGFDFLVDCMFYCYVCTVLSCPVQILKCIFKLVISLTP